MIVHYVDQNGKEISNVPQVTIDGEVGHKYETTPKEIPGYKYDHTTRNVTGTITEGNSDVYYYYDHEGNNQQGTVTVHYVDQNGNEITGVPTETTSGAVGTKYTTTPKNIAGYKYSYHSSNPIAGTFNTEDGVVYYHYVPTTAVENNDKGSHTMVSMTTTTPSHQPEKVLTSLTTPVNEALNNSETQPAVTVVKTNVETPTVKNDSQTTTVNEKQTNTPQNALPQTGENNEHHSILAGIMSVIAGILGMFGLSLDGKKHHQD